MGFTLREDLFFCVSNQQVTLLDLRKDRYFALPPGLDVAFQRLVSQLNTDADAPAISQLIDKQILVETTVDGFIAPAPQIPSPSRSFVDGFQPPTRPWLIAEALFWQWHTALRLRKSNLHAVISNLSSKIGLINMLSEPTENMLSSFLISRRVMPTQEQCLRWSIAMTSFLLRHGVYANLVIGVATNPFRAHAWVQRGETILSDRLDTVLRYTPILVV